MKRKIYWTRRKLRLTLAFSTLCLITLPISLVYGDDIEVTFRVNMQKARDNNCFVLGQPLLARCGYDSSAAQLYDVPLERVGFSFLYQGTATITATTTDVLLYRYVTYFDTTETDEYYFDHNDDSAYLWLKFKRKVNLSRGQVVAEDLEASNVTSHRMPIFPNPNVLSRDMVVTWECDMRPAYYALSAGRRFVNAEPAFPIDPITDPASIDSLGVFINGTPTGLWRFWRRVDLLPYQLFDDGTNGDATAGDSVYTIQLLYPGNREEFLVSHMFKMSINGGDNEGGTGALHMVNLDDGDSEVTVRFAWGEVDPNFYTEWDYDENHATSVYPPTSEILPQWFRLFQNYPNPFNATTHIRFTIPSREQRAESKEQRAESGEKGVRSTLKIYNLLGQEIVTLVDGELAIGQHSYQWKVPSDLPSGIYWCELKADGFRDLIKLLFLK
ncbi:MAG: choice-of-anchor X domain-containing protein [bacterium]